MKTQIISQEEFTTKFNILISIGQEFQISNTRSTIYISTQFCNYHMRINE